MNVDTQVGAKFLRLVDKHFPKGSKLHKAFNRNNLKTSYRCMPNIKSKMSAHNKATLKAKEEEEPNLPCNCRVKDNCPMQGKCRYKNIIYRAVVNEGDKSTEQSYIGLSSEEFKLRYNNHTSSFRHKNKAAETTLSKYIWELKDQGKEAKVSWHLLSQTPSYKPEANKCYLCLQEKFYILYHKNWATLNSRSEVANTCRHKNKFLLKNM